MRISVVICTCNRCEDLQAVLGTVACSELPPEIDWEALIVDNNSSDRTSEVARKFTAEYPDRFRYIFEPMQGKSHALNLGIQESRGDVIAFLDDDVRVQPHWLRNLARVFEAGEYAGAGGRTLILEPYSVPCWLPVAGPHSLGGFLAAAFDLGDQPCELRQAPFGANMAYRREMFEKYGAFRTDLGPGAGQNIPRSHEDTEFGRRLMAAGERLRYEPSAVVYHRVHQDRIRKEFFLDRCFDSGRGLVRSAGMGRDLWGIPHRYWKMAKLALLVLPSKTLRWFLSFDSQNRFSRKCLVWITLGQASELCHHPVAATIPTLARRGGNSAGMGPATGITVGATEK